MTIKSTILLLFCFLLSGFTLSAIACPPPDCGSCCHWEGPVPGGSCVLNSGADCGDCSGCSSCYSCTSCSCVWDCSTGQTCCNGTCCDNCCNSTTCCPNSDDICCTDSGSYCCESGKTCCQGTCCESGKCCDNGTCVTPSDWSTWEASVTVTMPDDVKNKIEAAINNIPNVDDVEVDEVEVSCTAKWRDCCTDGGTLISNGERYKKCTFTVSAEIGGIPIWGPPPFDETFEITGVLKADLKIKAGVTLAADFSVSATGGERWDDCDVGCKFGSVDADVDVALSLTLEIDICVKILWWEECGSIEFTPASVSVGITCGVSYNSETACDGLNGNCCLKDIIFKSDFKIGSDIGLHFEKTIYNSPGC